MNENIVPIPIEGVLDLHTFSPKDAKEIIPEYIYQCRSKGIREIKIIHGKGSGALKAMVIAQLMKIQDIAGVKDAEPCDGGWGATWVFLK